MTDAQHPAPLFAAGTPVRRVSDPAAVGIVASLRWSEQAEEWLYRIQFGLSVREVGGHDLQVLPTVRGTWDDFEAGHFSNARALQRLLTLERLRKPPTRIAAAFGTARAKLYPYQFKPLLKFLESPTNRLLIADDVGLGKTIEAGYILRELKARTAVDRVLVVVPARLQRKWKTEFERRFDEHFEIVRAREIRDRFLAPLRQGRDPQGFSWVVSYESLRGSGLATEFEELTPALDLVIVDEAHRARNPDALQSKAVRAVAECSDALVLLTATPVQTGLENLFQLLRIMAPDLFLSFEVFQRQIEANRPVARALAALRQQPPALRHAREELQSLARDRYSRPLTTSPFFQGILARLDEEPDGRRALVHLQRDISELSPTSQFVSRTRKVEVLPDRPVRVARSVKVSLSPGERVFYDSIADLCRSDSYGWGESMSALMVYRYTASCITASFEYLKDRLDESVIDVMGGVAEETEDDAGFLDIAEQSQGSSPAGLLNVGLRKAVQGTSGEFQDSKFRQFRDVLRTVWTEDQVEGRPRRKVVVFAFFKRTLAYLHRKLSAAGVDCRLIHGGRSLDERDSAIEDFLTRPEVSVLLSSEVGSEGLDLQEASVVVNYDLPWNPMVVEQRIGRIDRLGQRAPRINIINLVLEGTVEDRILLRLYERIGLFEQALGEIEPILGESVETLAADALRHTLSPEQEAERLDQTSNALINGQLQAERLQGQADSLIAGDQAFLDEVESLLGERRVPQAHEVFRFLKDFVDDRYPGATLPQGLIEDLAELHLPSAAATDLDRALPSDPDARRVSARIRQGALKATFEPDAYLRHPRAELLSLRHPLVRLAAHVGAADADSLHRTFRARVTSSTAPRGLYLFALIEFEVTGFRERVELEPLFWRVGDAAPLKRDAARRLLVDVIDVVEDDDIQDGDIDEDSVLSAYEGIQQHIDTVRVDFVASERALASAREERRRATTLATLTARVDAARRRLAQLYERQAPAFPIRMAEAQLSKAEAARQAQESLAVSDARSVVETRDVAVGLLRVH